jgi:ribosomal-protein-alanine N-acetyltransferase
MECVLRPWRAEDAGDLAAALNDRGILDNLRDGLPYPYTREDASDFITAMLAADPHEIYAFAITAEGRAVGSISLTRRENIHCRTAELGYYIARSCWGRGLTTDAVRQICAYIFEQTDILRIFAEPFADNIASCRVLEKAGFTLEGVLRKNAVKNGVVRDMKLYARLRE